MKIILLFVLLFTFKYSFAQTDESDSEDNVVYNLGISASTPGFSILELSPTSVERPKDPNNFAIFLQKATENFTLIPKNFALEFAPILLFKSKISLEEFKSKKFSDNFNQSFLFSVATTTTEATTEKPELTRMGVGFKFSFLRGDYSRVFTQEQAKYDSAMKDLETINALSLKEIQEKYKEDKILNEIQENKNIKLQRRIDVNKELNDLRAKEPKTDGDNEKIKTLSAEREELDDSIEFKLNEELDKRANNISVVYSNELREKINKIKETVSEIPFVREGIKLDFSAAVAYDFKNQNFNDGNISKIAMWMTLGSDYNVTKKSSQSFLTVLKITNTPNVNDTVTCSCGENIFRNSVTNVDFGIRYILDFSQFSLSGEAVARGEKYISPKYKYVLNFSYAIDNNTLTFTFGKDFDGSPYKKGNLIAALNFLLGLGSKRPL